MNNTLRQLEKNLRTFAKRCKGISYNKTLLFTFLFTGLTGYVLKAAPSDAEETLQKDVNATILDLRQSFKRTKEQNEKFLENANLEMAQLMMQGEQVIKSNWTSWQFGFGGMFNTQLSRYRGFGGKSDDIKYSRTNDLTKYVFDANQNHWNATTLDIKKNKEPDSKSIDPADIHQGYEPNTVTKLERVRLLDDANFNVSVTAPTAGYYTAIHPFGGLRGYTGVTGFEQEFDVARQDNNVYSTYDTTANNFTNTHTGMAVATVTPTGGSSATSQGIGSGSSFSSANTEYHSLPASTHTLGIIDSSGGRNTALSVTNGSTITLSGTVGISDAGDIGVRLTNGTIYQNGTISGTQGKGVDVSGGNYYQRGAISLGNNSVGIYQSGTASVESKGDITVGDNSVGINHAGGTLDATTLQNINIGKNSTGISTAGATDIRRTITSTSYGTQTGIKSSGNVTTNSGSINLTNVNKGTGIVSSGTVGTTSTPITVSGVGSNFGIDATGNVTASRGNITVSGSNGGNYGIKSGGVANVERLTITARGGSSTGRNTAISGGTGVVLDHVTAATDSLDGNVVYAVSGNITGGSYSSITAEGYRSNAVRANNGSVSLSTSTTVTTNSNESTAIKATQGVSLDQVSSATAKGSGSYAIYNNGSGNVSLDRRSSATAEQNYSLAIYNNGGATSSIFLQNSSSATAKGSHSHAIYAKTGSVSLSSSSATAEGDYSNAIFAEAGNITLNSSHATAKGYHSNAIHTMSGSTSMTNGSVTTGTGSRINGILLKSTSTGTTNNIQSVQFYVKGDNNNGIYLNDHPSATSTSITYNNFELNDGVDGVTGSNGILIAPGKQLTTALDHNSTTSYGTYNTGILVGLDANVPTITNGSHTVHGSNSTGIALHTDKSTSISNVYFTVTGQSSTGLSAGKTYVNTAAMPTLTIAGSTFDVYGGINNATSALYIKNVDKTIINAQTLFHIDNTSTGIELDNNGYNTANVREIEFNGVPSFTGGSQSVTMVLGRKTADTYTKMGDNNIGINIINGSFGTNSSKRSIKFGKYLDIYVESNKNTLINNQAFAEKLDIQISDKMWHDSKRNRGIIKIGRVATNDYSQSSYHDNTIFANNGYVRDAASKVDLKHIEIDGNRNKIAFFNTTNNNYDHGNNYYGWNAAKSAKIGWYNGTLHLQGVIGYAEGNLDNPSYASDGNVAVYAISGQRDEIQPSVFIEAPDHATGLAPTPGALHKFKNLRVDDINIGFSRRSSNGMLVYANNGTVVEVKNGRTIADGMQVADTITDGTYMVGNSHTWGYAIPYEFTSYKTTLMRADGIWDKDIHNIKTTTNGRNFDHNPTEIMVMSHVDMVSREGTAYLAVNGGRVTVGTEAKTDPAVTAKTVNTRMGGYNSIIARADGVHTNSKAVKGLRTVDEDPNDKLPKINDENFTDKGSRVIIKGGITAADNEIFKRDGGVLLPNKANTYNNIAAYATNNGDIIIKDANRNMNTAGTKSTVEEGSDTAANGNKSLIYGIAAYATGEGSNIIYRNTADGTTSVSKITVVSGENGALYATDKGYIEFAGDVVHQNNYTKRLDGKITQDSNGAIEGTRIARGISNTDNDHTGTPVFYVHRNSATDNSAIAFTNETNIDIYDGKLLAGNEYYHYPTNSSLNKDYNRGYSDYYKGKTATVGEETDYAAAKYRGMGQLKVKILPTPGYATYDGVNGVDLGLINQAKEELNWDSSRDGSGSATGTNYLSGVGKYAGGMTIFNPVTGNTKSLSGYTGFKSTIINSKLKIKEDVNLEDKVQNQNVSLNGQNDPFTNIAMEGVLVTNEGKTISGDVANSFRKGQGLSMANSLYRYDLLELTTNPGTATYRRSKNDEAGYNNYGGTINVWGGTARGNVQITGINVANATVNNGDGTTAKKGKITIDHGYGIAGSDNSVIKNKKDSEITVTGKYNPTTISELRAQNSYAAETEATGENYGIVGLSTNNVRDHATYGSGRYGENAIAIENVEGKIKVDGDLAVGIYAANKKYDNGGDGADQNRVTIKYDNKNAGTANLIDLNNGNTNKEKRDIGIALVNEVKDTVNAANRGGIITLNTKNTVATPDFVTKYRGIGIYGESTDIKFQNGSTGLTVETKDDGAGIWMTDDSHVGVAGDHNTRTYNYTYTGANDKKGFGMVFSSTMTGSNTVAENHLNIKFKNTGATTEGIAGILVNTDAGDWVKNYGKITEDPLQTTTKSFGAIVNKGTFENHGDITLHDSADIKKANVGIFANSHDNPAENVQTHIINYGDIKVGTPGQTKSFGIYGYNITHDKRADGTGGTITIGKESYGVYSGDGNVNIKGGKFTVGTNTVTTADERATGVYIEDNSRLTRMARTSEVSADMEIDDYSFGIVVKKNTNAELPGAANTHTIKIGAGSYGLDANGKVNSLIRTKIPEITLGRAASTDPVSPSSPTNLLTNAVYYHSQDKLSTLDSFADIKMNGDYNYAYYTAGSVNNYGNIDLRSNVDLLANGGLGNRNAEGSIKGYGNVGIYSTNYNVPSTNFGTITTGASDLINDEYSAAMAAGHYVPGISANSGRADKEGYIVNRGIINVQEHNGIGMFAVGANSIAKNYGTINLVGNNSIGMYLDQRAKGENYGTIISEAGSGTGIKGIVAINGAYIKNYGTIKIQSPFGKGIVTSNRQVLDDNEHSDVTGTQENIQLIAGTNEKTTGDGSTIRVPDLVPLTEVTINGVNTPIFKLDTNATLASPIASQITVRGSIQTGGTRIIDLSTWGNFGTASRSQVTRVGMYVDTSGVRYTNPIDGLENLHHLNEIDLLFGTEATQYTNAKAIELGENILKPYNDALRDAVAGGAILNPISANITWMAKDIKDPLTKLLKTVYLVKVPYTSFAVKGDENTYIFAENLEEKYETAKGNDKIIFNKVNGIGNGEGHILSQAFDEMKGHQYSNIQQRMQKTSDLLGTELDQLKNVWYNSSKDSNKIKSFGMKGEYKTDSATVKDYSNNAYGVAYVHEFETIRLGERTGFYAGAIYNRYNFKDIGHSKEDQYMMKAGLFRTTPFDENGTLTWTISGDGFISINEMKRRFWVVDDTFKAHSNYAAYGVTVNNEIGKEFGSIANGFDGFGVRLYGGLKLEYGRFTKIKEKGDMPLELKANGYYSARPEVGVQFKYRQPIFRGKTDFIAGLGFAFENELGKTGDVHNKARIRDTFKNYYSLTGEKDNKKGNFKSDLQLGLDNQRLGFTVNFGYDTKGNNMRGGLGFRAIY